MIEEGSEIEVVIYPQYPVSLRGKKSRYRVEMRLGSETYSATAGTPEKAARGAAAAADLFGGYEVEIGEMESPRHPLVEDVSFLLKLIVWTGKFISLLVKNFLKKVQS